MSVHRVGLYLSPFVRSIRNEYDFCHVAGRDRCQVWGGVNVSLFIRKTSDNCIVL